MTTLQSLKVTAMSEEQLCSFLTIVTFEEREYHDLDQRRVFVSHDDVAEWVEEFLDKDICDFSWEALQATIEKEYPDLYDFDGNTYIYDLEAYYDEQEESVSASENIDYLPLLGKCTFYPELGRIVYQERFYHADIFNEDNPKYDIVDVDRRISFADYGAKLLAEQEKIAAALLRIKQPE